MREEEETSQWSGCSTPTAFHIITSEVTALLNYSVIIALFFSLPSVFAVTASPSSLCSVSSSLLLPVVLCSLYFSHFLCDWTEERNSQLIQVAMATGCWAEPCNLEELFQFLSLSRWFRFSGLNTGAFLLCLGVLKPAEYKLPYTVCVCVFTTGCNHYLIWIRKTRLAVQQLH